MTSFLEHRNAGDLLPSWIGSRVSVQTSSGSAVIGWLSDYVFLPGTVVLYMGGRMIAVYPSATITRGDLDVIGSTEI